ncbi:MAG: signal peptidase II [Actinomycetota bacterium]
MRLPTTHWKSLYAIAWAIWLIDLATKIWALSALDPRNPVKLIGNFLQLTLLRNSGAAFSFAQSATAIFTIFAVVVIAVIAYFAPKITSKGWSIVLGLALGGILGNLTDRIFRSPGFFTGHVIDWIQLPHWPVFNLADSAIVVAAAIAVILSIRNISPMEA